MNYSLLMASNDRYVFDLCKSGNQYTVGFYDRQTKFSETYTHGTYDDAFHHFTSLRQVFFLPEAVETSLTADDFANID